MTDRYVRLHESKAGEVLQEIAKPGVSNNATVRGLLDEAKAWVTLVSESEVVGGSSKGALTLGNVLRISEVRNLSAVDRTPGIAKVGNTLREALSL